VDVDTPENDNKFLVHCSTLGNRLFVLAGSCALHQGMGANHVRTYISKICLGGVLAIGQASMLSS